jgi:serine phosphatase RsbU (regulator of sigma subunit)
MNRVVLYTDGFTESFAADNEMLGVEGMAEIVRDTVLLVLAQMKREILERVRVWRRGPPADDMSLILAEIS